jgi:hypothetical protein
MNIKGIWPTVRRISMLWSEAMPVPNNVYAENVELFTSWLCSPSP